MRDSRTMRLLGIDLAWGEVNESGVVALDPDGTIADAGWTVGVEQAAAWANEHAAEDTLLFVDAPLLVLNERAQRLCEREVGRQYGRWKVSANSTNLASPRLAGVELRKALEGVGWQYADGLEGPPTGGKVLSECYPYTTLVGAAEFGYEDERPTYKRKPGSVSTAAWRQLRANVCAELIHRIARLADTDPPMRLTSHPVTRKLMEEQPPLTDRDYKHREDLVDASIAAWTAALWSTHGWKRCQVLGFEDPITENGRRATIVAPARRAQRLYREVPMPERFVLEAKGSDREWIDVVVGATPEDFIENRDGSYVFWGGASGHWIRALAVSKTGIIDHVDGGGHHHRYRLVELPSPRYPGV